MKDIEAYIFVTLYAEQFNMDEETVLVYLNKQELMPSAITPHDLRMLKEHPPSVKYLCHALRELGYTVGWIANYLHIPQPNVSYHLKTKLKQDWVHPTWQGMREYIRRQMLETKSKYNLD